MAAPLPVGGEVGRGALRAIGFAAGGRWSAARATSPEGEGSLELGRDRLAAAEGGAG